MLYKTFAFKFFFLAFFVGLALQCLAQQKTHLLIDMNGIGQLKIGMNQEEIEKLLNKKFMLRNAMDTAVSHHDTAFTKYQNTSVQLFFQRQYTSEHSYYMTLFALKTKSPLYKTEEGITVGADKLKIISAYEAYELFTGPEFEDEAQTIRSKIKHLVTVVNDGGDRRLVFYLRNKKVEAIEVTTVFTDEEK